ncbi:MAG: hypothetical protein ACRDSK_11530 [Actinophytocola sp.]|uniref:hypothetical protein n=1 Tax=Actinophytocola sp. TaxID=1872138 RepID=UPI003D6C59B0
MVPNEDPSSFVVTDIDWQCPFAVGTDLGQLLVGLTNAGTLPVPALPALHEEVIDAYTDGPRTDGHAVPQAE